jgi:hypothetical protein
MGRDQSFLKTIVEMVCEKIPGQRRKYRRNNTISKNILS